jgi:cbb3-type cytochrome oxidase cytochrome c subunit
MQSEAMRWGHLPLAGESGAMAAPATMQSEAMRWGHLPLAGESGAMAAPATMQSEAMRRSGADNGIR